MRIIFALGSQRQALHLRPADRPLAVLPQAQAVKTARHLALGAVPRAIRHANSPVAPIKSRKAVVGSGTTAPLSEKAMLKVGGVAPPKISVPIRSQSGSRPVLRI
jgi:hypothetical protein